MITCDCALNRHYTPIFALPWQCDIMEYSSIDKYADFIVTAISTAVNRAIPTSKNGRPESQLVSEELRRNPILLSMEEVAEQVAMRVTNTLLNFAAFGESADKESSSETENFQNRVTAKPDAVMVGEATMKKLMCCCLLTVCCPVSVGKKWKERKILCGLAKYRNWKILWVWF